MSPQMTQTLAPEQLFSDPADVIDWLRTLPEDGGAGVSQSAIDCTLARYARFKLEEQPRYLVRVGAHVYTVTDLEVGESVTYSNPNWVTRFIGRHDSLHAGGSEVPIADAILHLKEVVHELRIEAALAERTVSLWSGVPSFGALSGTPSLFPWKTPTLAPLPPIGELVVA